MNLCFEPEPVVDSLVMSGKLARKRKDRTGHRISTRKIISSAEEILETFDEHVSLSPLNLTRLLQQKLLLQEKLETIRNIDEEILSAVQDSQIDEEICEADEFAEFTQLVIMRIDSALTTSQQSPSTKLEITHTLPETTDAKLETETPLTPSASPEPASKLSEAHLTPSTSPEAASKLSEAHLTPSTSPETASKLSEAHLTPSTLPEIASKSSETSYSFNIA